VDKFKPAKENEPLTRRIFNSPLSTARQETTRAASGSEGYRPHCERAEHPCAGTGRVLHHSRRHELTALDARDIDFDRKRITVQNGKGGKTRIVPIIDDEHLSDLAHLLSTRRQGAVFVSNQDKALSLRSVNYVIEAVAKHTGIENPNPRLQHLNPHIFRHSIARFLKSKGFTAEWIQNFLGHQSYQTTMDMYGTISIDEMQEVAVRKLGE
jgi:integrase